MTNEKTASSFKSHNKFTFSSSFNKDLRGAREQEEEQNEDEEIRGGVEGRDQSKQ